MGHRGRYTMGIVLGLMGMLWLGALGVGAVYAAQAPKVHHETLDAKLDEILTNQEGLDAKLDNVLDNQVNISQELDAVKLALVAAVCGGGLQRYVDLLLTVFDCQTNLEWEKKLAADGSEGGNCNEIVPANRDVRCVNNGYSWSTCGGGGAIGVNPCPLDGTAQTEFLDTLNADKFAGHDDWRLPEMGPPFPNFSGIKLNGDPADTQELETIINCGFGPPCIDPIFGPTAEFIYWSSVTRADSPELAWFINFFNGDVNSINKILEGSVRAVRTGP